MAKRRVAVFGSAFNPPHLGHKDVIEQIYRDYDEILLVPNYRHAFGKAMVPFEDRLSMTSTMAQCIAIAHPYNQVPIATSDIERELAEITSGPIYTYDVLQTLEKRYCENGEQCELTFVIGPDNAAHEIWQKFYRGEEIRQRWQIRTVSERIAVHSTKIRELIAEYTRPAALFEARFREYLDTSIAQYIFEHQLYGANP